MPTITAIGKQQFNNIFNISIDGKFAFSLDPESIIKQKLHIGQEISPEKIKEFAIASTYQKILNSTLAFLTLRPRSQKELDDYLNRKKAPLDIAQKVIEKAKSLELIDDAKFTQWWIDQRQTFRPRSHRQLLQELKSKGIAAQTLNESIKNTPKLELQTAQRLLLPRLARWKGLPERDFKQKAHRFLSGKGFDWEIVKSTVASVLEK